MASPFTLMMLIPLIGLSVGVICAEIRKNSQKTIDTVNTSVEINQDKTNQKIELLSASLSHLQEQIDRMEENAKHSRPEE